MHRFYVAALNGDCVSLSDAAQLHHLRDVLRLKAGDQAIVFDGQGNQYDCVITRLTTREAVLAVKGRSPAKEGNLTIAVACAIPRKSRMDDIVDSLTQLGVDAIVPLETGRVVVRLDEGRKEERLQRWRRIARSAAAQSQRNSIPEVEPVTTLEAVLARAGDFDLRLIPTLHGERRHIREVLAGAKPARVMVLIGPEGDFTPDEVEQAEKAGFVPVSLGDNVLRVATAATAVVSYLRLALAAPDGRY